MSAQRQLLTPEDFKGWLRINAVTNAETEAMARAQMADNVLRGVAKEMQQRGIQDACDRVWRQSKGMGLTGGEKLVVRETLESIGWMHRKRRGDER